ncbi:MAG: hypothetical protein KGI54_19080 [Pseudomonadota bacterium]|nr:hypothetical protein [Pseudomonadota bacterium]
MWKNSFQNQKSFQEPDVQATFKTVSDEMRAALRDIAGARGPDDTVEALIVRAAKLLKDMSYSQVNKLWYGNASIVRAEHADEIRKARKAALRAKIARQKEEITMMQRKLDEWP